MAVKTENQWGEITAELAERIRLQHPLIHHITNYVVMNDTANATLALGASPVMAHAREEVAELVSVAGALVLNPGTLSRDWVESMLIAGRRANEIGVPIVYDPVGAGATRLRNETGRSFLDQLRLAVIRGNSGEIGALSGLGGQVRGSTPLKDSGTRSRQPGAWRKNTALWSSSPQSGISSLTADGCSESITDTRCCRRLPEAAAW